MTGNPNLIAHLVLLLWLPACFLLGAKARGPKGFLLVFLGGTLALPEQLAIKVPVLPPINKHMITMAACTFVCTSAYRGSKTRPTWVMPTLICVLVGSAFLTARTNPEAVHIGPRILQGMTLYDGFSIAVSDLCLIALPFYLGMRHFRTVDDLRFVLLGIAIAALVYAPFTLLEARLSPVLHRWVYGYFQHDWLQAKRAGGFRAFVFLQHGLAVAFLYAQAVIVALSIWREKTVDVSSPLRTSFYILFPLTLVACKSLGATLYAAAAGILFLVSGPKGIGSLARILALFSLCFPLIRYNGWFPTEDVLRWATDLDPLRAESLAFRFRNEENLLAEASRKYWYGWGGWGRGRIYDEVTGKNLTVVDGFWIIVLSGRGLVGFLTQFGLLTLPILSAIRRLPQLARSEMSVLATAAFIATISVVELLPNGLFHLFPWVLAGALTSVSAELKAPRERRALA
jgi:hypothetical protein